MMNEEKKSSMLYSIVLLAGIILFSTVEISSKELVAALSPQNLGKINSWTLVFVRFIITGIMLVAMGLPDYLKKNKLTDKDYGIFLLNGFISIACSISLFHTAINMLDKSSSAAVIFSANALFTIVFARFINKEALNVKKIIAVILGLIGISFFVCEKGTPELSSLKGILVMCASAMLFSIGVCITRRVVKRYGATLYMGMSSLFGAIIVLPFTIYYMRMDGFDFTMQQLKVGIWPLSYLIVFGTAMGYLCYYKGLTGVSAFEGAMAFFLKPALACLFARMYLGDEMNIWTITGTLIITCSMFMTVSAKNSKKIEASTTKKE